MNILVTSGVGYIGSQRGRVTGNTKLELFDLTTYLHIYISNLRRCK